MIPCLTLCGPQLICGERRAAHKQRWLCSKGKAAFVCQYGYSWVKSAVFYKSLLRLGAVGLVISGARGKVEVAAPSRQTAACGCSPNQTLHLCLLERAFLAAEPEVELVSRSFMRPCPNPSIPLGLCGRKAASSGPRRCQGGVTGVPAWWTQGPQQPLKAHVVAAALKYSPSVGEEVAAPHSCLSRAFCVALSLTHLSCVALRRGR